MLTSEFFMKSDYFFAVVVQISKYVQLVCELLCELQSVTHAH